MIVSVGCEAVYTSVSVSVIIRFIRADVLQVVRTAAPVGTGLRELEEAILLQAEMLEVAAPVEGRAEGTVVEARLDKGQGPVATVVVRAGTLRVGDSLVVGKEYGRVRQLRAPDGRVLQAATPGAHNRCGGACRGCVQCKVAGPPRRSLKAFQVG